jgi:hypothetical protein
VARIDRPISKQDDVLAGEWEAKARCKIITRIAQSWKVRQKTNPKQKHQRSRRSPRR